MIYTQHVPGVLACVCVPLYRSGLDAVVDGVNVVVDVMHNDNDDNDGDCDFDGNAFNDDDDGIFGLLSLLWLLLLLLLLLLIM